MAKQKSTQSKTDTKERTSLYVSGNILRSIKFIAFSEEKPQTEIMDQALSEFVERWEKKNGPVPPQKA